MSYERIKFKKEHAFKLLEQPMNHPAQESYYNGLAQLLEEQPDCHTGVIGGRVMFCGGIVPYWPGRGWVWALFSEESKLHFVPMIRDVKRFFTEQLATSYRRLELAVPFDFAIGHRRAEHLGFKVECERAKYFLPDGGDCSLYVLTRG